MNTLNLSEKKVSKLTVTLINEFKYNNRNEMSNDLKMFYCDVAGLIELQLRKSAAQRMTMAEILERAYNIEFYVLATGAASFETEFIEVI